MVGYFFLSVGGVIDEPVVEVVAADRLWRVIAFISLIDEFHCRGDIITQVQ